MSTFQLGVIIWLIMAYINIAFYSHKLDKEINRFIKQGKARYSHQTLKKGFYTVIVLAAPVIFITDTLWLLLGTILVKGIINPIRIYLIKDRWDLFKKIRHAYKNSN